MTTERKTMLLLLALDVLATLVVFNLLGHYRGIAEHFILTPLAFPLAVLVCAIYLIDGYRLQTDMLSVDYTSLHTIAGAFAMLVTLLLTFALFPQGYELHSSRGVIALSFVVLIPLTIGYRRLIYQQTAPNRIGRNLLFLGDTASCGYFRDECFRMGMQQPVLHAEIGEVPRPPPSGKTDGLHRSFDGVIADIEGGRVAVEAIVMRESTAELPPAVAQQLVRLFFQGVPTYTLEFFHQVYWQKIPLSTLDPLWLFQRGFQITREPVFERLKRVSDVVLSGLGLLFSAPLVLCAMAAIWLEDRGPVFFRQTRTGRNGVPFRLLKLRSMRLGSSQANPYTQVGDTRITRVGRFLRASRIDEFPQMWNVFCGEMSLIGPRAEWDRLVADYEKQIPCYYFRHLVKPGITGWAQVNYPYGANLADTVRKLEYDLYYIRYFSFLLDASIVLKTIHIMLFGKGR